MTFGLSISAFTTLHVIISLIAMGTGFMVMYGLTVNRSLPGWTRLFLVSIILTSVTGFMFPGVSLGPPLIFGVISLITLAIVLHALYSAHLKGYWRWIYVAGVFLAHYLNVVVGVVQAFAKIGFLRQLAPEQSEPPFLLVQAAMLLLFGFALYLALRRFHPEAATGLRAA